MRMNNKWPVVVAAAFLIMSCNDAQEKKVSDAADTVESRLDNTVDNIEDEYSDYRDENFVENIYEENKEEMFLLELGISKGSSNDVQRAAKEMLGDHEKLDAELKAYATKHGISLDEKTMNDALETRERGVEWDKDWADKLENAHSKVIRKFERKQQNANDEELMQIVNKTLPVLNKHLNMVQML